MAGWPEAEHQLHAPRHQATSKAQCHLSAESRILRHG